MNYRKASRFLILCFAFALLMIIFLAQRGNALPSYPGDDHSCHNVPGPYSISSSNGTTLQVSPGASFDINVTAMGTPNLNVKIYSEAQDNSKFPVSPLATIPDNSAYDQNASADGIIVTFTFTAPSASGTYKILILALDPTMTEPAFAPLEFVVTVGAGGINLNVFSHLSIYIGLTAVICLAVGTILYEKNNELTKAHGILAGIAFALTTLNVIFVIPLTSTTINSWIAGTAIDWMHFIHITFGIIGYSAGFIAVFTGISGIRTKKPGYVALIFWTFNLIFGLITWGVNL